MVTAAWIGIVIFTILLFIMVNKVGNKVSLSALTENYKYLVALAFLSQTLLLPQMITITPEYWKVLPFFGVAGIIFCGITNVLDKNEELVHMIAAVTSFICLTAWVILINKFCILPLIMCLISWKDNIKWKAEIGLIISVYLTLILSTYTY